MALKGVTNFEVFKDELRSNIKYLEDFGGLGSAHLMGEVQAQYPQPGGPSIEPTEDEETSTEIGEGDIPAFVLQG